MVEKIHLEEFELYNTDQKIRNLSLKINELVDAVNSIVSVQKKLIDSRFVVETKHEEPADPYAEQRKWIGKVCRFFDSDKDDARIGVLSAIQNGMYFIKHTSTAYDYCEPVKPDDDIIYKGGDNE